MSGTLYTFPDNFRSFKVLLTAEYAGNPVIVDPNFVFHKTNTSPEFLKKFPLGKVPAFESADGQTLFESNAIAYYVSNQELRGQDHYSAALIQQWVSFAENEILPSVCKWVFPTYGIMQYHKGETEAAKEQLKKCFKVLDDHLLCRTYLVGERVSLADITLACNLLMLFKQVAEPSFRDPYINVVRWFTTLINQPQFKKVIGDVDLCEHAAQFDAKKFAEYHGGHKRDGHRRDSHNKNKQKHHHHPQGGAQQKKAEEGKEKKPVEDSTPAETGDLTENADAGKFTDKDLNAMSSGEKFIMDDFKRSFSNEDTMTKAIPLLWETFDQEHFSLFHAKYKYKDELQKLFMTSNLMKGLFQRVEKLRKFTFCVAYVLGVDNDNNIEELWMMKGKELVFSLNDDWNIDAPSYEFTKLDTDKETDRDLVNAFLLGASYGSYSFPPEDKQASYYCFK